MTASPVIVRLNLKLFHKLPIVNSVTMLVSRFRIASLQLRSAVRSVSTLSSNPNIVSHAV